MPDNAAFDPFDQVRKAFADAQQTNSTPGWQAYADRFTQLANQKAQTAQAAAQQQYIDALKRVNVQVSNTGGKTAVGTPSTWTPGKRADLENVMYGVAKNYGWSDDEARAWGDLINRESGWRPDAKNPTSTAFGLGQFLDSTWAGTGYQRSGDPSVQLQAMAKYIKSRYGTPAQALAFWKSAKPINGKSVGNWY